VGLPAHDPSLLTSTLLGATLYALPQPNGPFGQFAFQPCLQWYVAFAQQGMSNMSPDLLSNRVQVNAYTTMTGNLS